MSKFNLRRSLPLFITSATLLVSLSSCGGDSAEVSSLKRQIEALQRDVDVKDSLIDTYLLKIRDLQEMNNNYMFENNDLQQKINEAESNVKRLNEALENIKQATTEDDNKSDKDDGKKNDVKGKKKNSNNYKVNITKLDPLNTEIASEMEDISYSAENLWIFDTSKLEEGDTSFDNPEDYRNYFILQVNSFYDSYQGVWYNLYESFFNGSVDMFNQKYYNYFIGEINYVDGGYVASAGHYDGMIRSMYSLETLLGSISRPNPVPLDCYSKLNDFLIANNLGKLVKDTYTEADLLYINLTLNCPDLEVKRGTSR